MGRPKKEKAFSKDRQVTVRLSEMEYEIIEKSAMDAGMTIAAYMRHMAVHGNIRIEYPVIADSNELKKLTNEFAAIGNNLNQIARYFHMGGSRSKQMQENINMCIAAIMDMRKEVVRMAGDYHVKHNLAPIAISKIINMRWISSAPMLMPSSQVSISGQRAKKKRRRFRNRSCAFSIYYLLLSINFFISNKSSLAHDAICISETPEFKKK